MDLTLTGLICTELFVYFKDIVIFADTLEEHETKFNNLAEGLRNANLHLQPSANFCEQKWDIHVTLLIKTAFALILKSLSR